MKMRLTIYFCQYLRCRINQTYCMFCLSLLVLALSYFPASAFSEDGFDDGMTIDDVQSILGRDDSYLVLIGTRAADGFSHYVANKGGHKQFEFCKDRLVGYSRALSGFTELAAVLERETKELGEASYNASVSEAIEGWAPPEEHNRAFSKIEFSWKTSGGVTGLRIDETRGLKTFSRDKPRLSGDWIIDVSANFEEYWGSGKPCE